LKKRDFINAEGMLRRAIQFDPNNKSAHYMLGQLLQQTNRAEEAKRAFATAEKLQGSNESPER
jgi:cytochrome c-type biogenesis protein CcmH/NrfG